MTKTTETQYPLKLHIHTVSIYPIEGSTLEIIQQSGHLQKY